MRNDSGGNWRYNPLMNCKPCTHAQRDRIDADLIHGRPLRTMVAEYGCSLGSLSRHRQHVRELIREHISGEREERGGALVNRVEQVLARAKELVETAMTQKNVRAANGSLRTILACLELIGKLTDELAQPNSPAIHFTQRIQVNSYSYGDDDHELATLIGEATKGFSLDEFMRLKRLANGDNSGTLAVEDVKEIEIAPVREAR